jgi:hypothetical protein
MQRRIKVLLAALAVFALAPMAYSVVTTIGRIILNETKYEKFGVLYFPFTFRLDKPQVFILCEKGVNPAGGGCIGGVELESDHICVTNISGPNFSEGLVAMLSQATETARIVVPPDFPCSLDPKVSTITFLAETGKAQVLSPKTGFVTVNPDGSLGPPIKVIATSDLETTSTTSDTLIVATQ